MEQERALRAQRNTSLMLGVEKRLAHSRRGEGFVSDLGLRISGHGSAGQPMRPLQDHADLKRET